MKKRSLSGNAAIAIFAVSIVLVFLAFFTWNWLVSDSRITGAQFDRLGLWYHCFRSLPDPNDVYERRFFANCHWIFDPFTTGYDRIRGYLVPTFMLFTELFYTATFLIVLVAAVGVIIFASCMTPDDERFLTLTLAIGWSLIAGGISAAFACLIFGFWANRDDWMPGHDNNFFGWSFGVAIVSAFSLIASGVLFLTEKNVQERKRILYNKGLRNGFDMDPYSRP